MKLLTGSASHRLAERIAGSLGTSLAATHAERFPDGEVDVVVDPDLRGESVYVVQSTGPPADEHLIELMMLSDAARRCGAERIVAIVPYLAYARQDRRTEPGRPVGIRLVGDLLATAGIDRLVVVDPHTRDLEAILSVPVEAATAIPLLAGALEGRLPQRAVVVAPDLGAVKIAERYADLLDRPVAMVRKTRLSGDRVRADAVVGDVRGRHPVIVDDMISTGGTLVAAAGALTEAGAAGTLTVVATHALLAGDADRRLSSLPADRIVVSDTVAPPADPDTDLTVVSTAPLLADAIQRLETDRRLDDLESFG